jgi:hypothetical protein
VPQTNSNNEEPEGMKAAAYIANELDKGTPMDDLIKEFNDDERSVKVRVAFINYHKWVTRDIDGKWHLANKGRLWVRRLLGAFSCVSPLMLIKSLEEAVFDTNILSFI